MATFLFDKIVFGPIKSRRLGISLGINLLPVSQKLCNFDCVYCECGLNTNNFGNKHKLPTRLEVSEALETKLREMSDQGIIPDVITFAGNGEPTMHPDFSAIIDDTVSLRDKYFKTALISVLSNSTMLHKKAVMNALKKTDQNIMKLDSGLMSTINILNRPTGKYNLKDIVRHLKMFEGKVIIQSMFTRGEVNGIGIDNTNEGDLSAWEKIIKEINPEKVMIYTIDRDTPYQGLKKIPGDELLVIAERIKKIGVQVQVNG